MRVEFAEKRGVELEECGIVSGEACWISYVPFSKAEMQKLKRYLKNTGEQHSRKSKGKKRNRNV